MQQVSNYLPRLGLFALGLPRALEQLLEYTFRVSAALALINMAPVIYFDGQAALNVLIVYIGNTAILPLLPAAYVGKSS